MTKLTILAGQRFLLADPLSGVGEWMTEGQTIDVAEEVAAVLIASDVAEPAADTKAEPKARS